MLIEIGSLAGLMKRFPIAGLICALVACSSNVPPPNGIRTRYEPSAGVVQVLASNIRPMSNAELIGPDGARYRTNGIVLVSGPHVLYNPPPSVGVGIGGFGFTGCCAGIGSGLGLGFPVGGPRPAEVSDQFLTSATIPAPPDYAKDWMKYRVQVQIGENAAPSHCSAGHLGKLRECPQVLLLRHDGTAVVAGG